MKLFECQNCGQPLYFENTHCESCGHRLGYLPQQATVTALEPAAEAWRAIAVPQALYRFCTNAVHDTCNWLIAAEADDTLCAACRHNRTIPDLSIPENLLNWRKVEVAKHRLFYTLLRLGLPLAVKPQDPNGLAFDFLAAPAGGPVITGHARWRHHHQSGRGRRCRARAGTQHDGRTLSDAARSLPPRDCALLLGSPHQGYDPGRRIPRRLR